VVLVSMPTLIDESDPIGQGVMTVAVPRKTIVRSAADGCEGSTDPLRYTD
jgi:hypothetical protein